MSGLGTGLLRSDQGQGTWVPGPSSKLDPSPSRSIYVSPAVFIPSSTPHGPYKSLAVFIYPRGSYISLEVFILYP